MLGSSASPAIAARGRRNAGCHVVCGECIRRSFSPSLAAAISAVDTVSLQRKSQHAAGVGMGLASYFAACATVSTGKEVATPKIGPACAPGKKKLESQQINTRLVCKPASTDPPDMTRPADPLAKAATPWGRRSTSLHAVRF
jgi:hypothetical protein